MATTPLGRNLGPGAAYKLSLPKPKKSSTKSSKLPTVYKPSLVAGTFQKPRMSNGAPAQGAGSSSPSSTIFGSSQLGLSGSMNPFLGIKFPAPLTATQQAAKNYNDAHPGGSSGGFMSLVHGGEGILGKALDIISRPANAMAVMGSAELAHNHNNFWSGSLSDIPAMAHGFMQGLEGKQHKNFAQDLQQGHMLNGHSWVRDAVGLTMDIAGDPLNLIGGAGVYKDVGEGAFGAFKGLQGIERAGNAEKIAKLADMNGGTIGRDWLAHSAMVASKGLKDAPGLSTDKLAEMTADAHQNALLESLANKAARGNMNKYLGLKLGVGRASVTLRTPLKIGLTTAEKADKIAAGGLKIRSAIAHSLNPAYLDPVGHAAQMWQRHTAEDLTRQTWDLAKNAMKPFLKGEKNLSKKEMQHALIAASETPGVVNTKTGELVDHVLTAALKKQGIEGDKAVIAKEFVDAYHRIGQHLRVLDKLHNVDYAKGAIEDKVYVPHTFEHGTGGERIPYMKSQLSKAGYAEKAKKIPYSVQLKLAEQDGTARKIITDPIELLGHRVQKGAVQATHGVLRQMIRDSFARPMELYDQGRRGKAFAKVDKIKAGINQAEAHIAGHEGRMFRSRMAAAQTRSTFQRSLEHAVAENKKKIADLTEKLHGVQGRGRGTLQSQMNAAKKAQADLQRIVEEAPHQKEYERTVNAAKRGPGGKFRPKADQLSARLAAGQKRSVFQQSLDHAIAQNKQKINDLTVQLSGAQGRVRATLTTSMTAAQKEQTALQKIVDEAPHEKAYTQAVTDAGVKHAKSLADAKTKLDTLGKALLTEEPKAAKRMWKKNPHALEDGWKEVEALSHPGTKASGKLHYTVPPELHASFANIEKAMIDPTRMRGIEKSFTKAMSIWKLSVTSVNPGYRIRNSLSDLWNMYVSGVPIQSIPLYAAKAMRTSRLARKGEQKMQRLAPLLEAEQRKGGMLDLEEFRKLWLFHGTNAEAGASITKDAALTPSPIGVHLTTDLEGVAHPYATREGEGAVAMVHSEDLKNAGGTRNGPLAHSENPVPVRAVVKPGSEEQAMRREYELYRTKGAKGALALTPAEKEAMTLIRTAHSQGVMSGLFEGDIGKGVNRLRRTGKNPVTAYGRKMTTFNSEAENIGRLTHYMWRLDHGHSTYSAAEFVRAAHFDYEDLSPFEQRVMKNIAPFYTWTRKNVPYQIQALATHPGRVATYGKVANTAGQMSGAKPSDIIGHALDYHPMAIRFGSGYIDPQIGLNDLYNAENIFHGGEIGMLNPALQDAVMLQTGRSLQTGQSLTGPDASHQAVPAPGLLSGLLQPFGLGETTQRPVNGVAKYGPGVNPWVAQVADQIPLGSYAMSFNPITEAQKGSTPFGVGPRTLSYFGGLSYTNVDKQQQLAIAAMETDAADKMYIKHLRDQGLMTPSSWKPGNSWFDNYLKKYNKRQTQAG